MPTTIVAARVAIRNKGRGQNGTDTCVSAASTTARRIASTSAADNPASRDTGSPPTSAAFNWSKLPILPFLPIPPILPFPPIPPILPFPPIPPILPFLPNDPRQVLPSPRQMPANRHRGH